MRCSMAFLVLLSSILGCAAGADGAGGAGAAGVGGSTTSSGTGGAGGACEPGTTEPCYGGPEAQAGVGICALGTRACSTDGWGDCEGWVAASTEACDAAMIDENCDGTANEGCDCSDGETMACGSDVGRCEAGMQTCAGGRWGPCMGGKEPLAEACSGGLDEDCDGQTDCADGDCAADPSCSATCGNGFCEPAETPLGCPCDCSGCTTDLNCGGTTPHCCIPCGCQGPATQCVTAQNCCG